MSRHVMQAIKPLRVEVVPPRGATAHGTTEDGKQIYRLVTRRSRAVPKFDKKTGERIWRKNPLNGEPLLPVNGFEIYEKVELFTLENDGRGNIKKVPLYVPTEAEVAVELRKARIAAAQARLAEAMADDPGILEDLLSRRRDVTPQPAADAGEGSGSGADEGEETGKSDKGGDESPPEWPKALRGGWWQLSSGRKVQGSKDFAAEQEAEVTEEERSEFAQSQADAAATEGY